MSGEFLVVSGEGQAYSEQEADTGLGQTGWKKIERTSLEGATSLSAYGVTGEGIPPLPVKFVVRTPELTLR